jgi:hypothetical protein
MIVEVIALSVIDLLFSDSTQHRLTMPPKRNTSVKKTVGISKGKGKKKETSGKETGTGQVMIFTFHDTVDFFTSIRRLQMPASST